MIIGTFHRQKLGPSTVVLAAQSLAFVYMKKTKKESGLSILIVRSFLTNLSNQISVTSIWCGETLPKKASTRCKTLRQLEWNLDVIFELVGKLGLNEAAMETAPIM